MDNPNTNKYKLRVIGTMLVWSTVGIFVREVNLGSIEIAFFRSFIGGIFIVLLSLLRKEKIEFEEIKSNLKVLLASGASLGLGWALLFQGYKYTTVSNATLAYYIAPILIIIMSAVLLKEKISVKKALCVVIAMLGLFLIVNSEGGMSNLYNHKLGITYAIAGGFFYASLVILNKFVKEISNSTMTIVQLFMATIVLLPFLIVNGTGIFTIDIKSLIFLLMVGVIHTGFMYIIYLSTIKHLEGQTLAILSYIDPIFAVILSGMVLKESISFLQMLGGFMILGAAFISEYRKKDLQMNKGGDNKM